MLDNQVAKWFLSSIMKLCTVVKCQHRKIWGEKNHYFGDFTWDNPLLKIYVCLCVSVLMLLFILFYFFKSEETLWTVISGCLQGWLEDKDDRELPLSAELFDFLLQQA